MRIHKPQPINIGTNEYNEAPPYNVYYVFQLITGNITQYIYFPDKYFIIIIRFKTPQALDKGASILLSHIMVTLRGRQIFFLFNLATQAYRWSVRRRHNAKPQYKDVTY